MTDIYERGSSLQKLLSTLKLNRERVPLETLKRVYRIPYEELKAQIRESVQEFVLLVACHHLLINPNFSLDEQTAVVQAAIDRSRMPKEIGKSLTRDYDVSKIHRMALKLSEHVFYEDYEFATFPCCHAASITPLDIFLYVYRIGDANQSVSDANQLKRISHVETVLRRLLREREKLPSGVGRDYAAAKAQGLLMSYLTTTLLVCPDKARGRAMAKRMGQKFQESCPEGWAGVAGKYRIFCMCSRLNLTNDRFQAILDNPIMRKIRGKHSFS